MKESLDMTRGRNKSPDLSQSFYSQVNMNNNTSDLMDFFTERKRNYGSGSRLNRSISRENHTMKALENRIMQQVE